MTTAALNPAAVPDPTQFFQRAINAMWNLGVDMLGRIQGAPKLGSFDHLPKRWRHPQRAELRLTRTLDWVLALARTLAGDSLYLRRAKGPAPAKPRAPRKPRAQPAPPAEPPTETDLEERRFIGRLRYMRMVFATQPTSRIARRLARRIGAKQDTDGWPEELLTISETPAAWAARAHRVAPQSPIHPEPEPPPPDPPPQADPTPVAFHPRE